MLKHNLRLNCDHFLAVSNDRKIQYDGRNPTYIRRTGTVDNCPADICSMACDLHRVVVEAEAADGGNCCFGRSAGAGDGGCAALVVHRFCCSLAGADA